MICFLPNYCTYSCKHTVKQFLKSSDYSQCAFCLLLYKGIFSWYSFELHGLMNAIQMSTHNICLYEENQEKLHNHYQISLFLIFFIMYGCTLSRSIHILTQLSVPSNFEKTLAHNAVISSNTVCFSP